MGERKKYRPFTGDIETKVRPQQSLLTLVMCQVRWPQLSRLEAHFDDIVLRVGEAIEAEYPIKDQGQSISYTVTPDGITANPSETTYRFSGVSEQKWTIILSQRAASIQCERYVTFNEFLPRLRQLFEVLSDIVEVPVYERVGLRHVNRYVDEEGEEGYPLAREILGLAALDLNSSGDVELQSALNQALFKLPHEILQVRSGKLAQNETIDPEIQALDVPSWVLDIDSWREGRSIFAVESVMETVQRFADINYDFFKLVWKGE